MCLHDRDKLDVLREQYAELLQKYAQLQRQQEDMATEVLRSAPECWEDDRALESIARDFIRALVRQHGKKTHREHCDSPVCGVL